MAIDITKILLSSTLDTLKNFPTVADTTNIPATSYTAGQFKTYTITLPLDKTDALAQVYINYSVDASKWFVGALTQVTLNANFLAQTRALISGTDYQITVYVINNSGVTNTSPAFTVSSQIRRFVGPFN